MGLERGIWPGLAVPAAVVAALVLVLTSGPVGTTSVRGPAAGADAQRHGRAAVGLADGPVRVGQHEVAFDQLVMP